MGDPSAPDSTCQSCGEPLEQSDNFCPSCGTRNEAADSRVPNPGSTRRREHRASVAETERGAGGWDGESSPVGGQRSALGGEPTPGAPGSAVGKETPSRTIGIAVGLGILGMLLLAIVSIAVGVLAFPLGLSVPQLLVAGTALGQLVGFAGLALVYLRRRGFSWDTIKSYLGVRVPTLREIGAMIGGYVGILATFVVIGIIASLFFPEPAENEGARIAAENPEIIPVMILMMLLIVGPCEELLYRGVVQNRLRETLSPLPAIAIASAVFAAVHVIALAGDPTGMLVTITILFFPSMIFGAIYEYTGNIVVPALLHGIHNSILLTLLFFAPELEEMEGASVLVETVLVVIPL